MPRVSTSPISASCQTTKAGSTSSITKASSCADCRQFAGQNAPPSLAAAPRPSRIRNEFWPSHRMRSPGPKPSVAQRVGQLVHPIVELGPGEANVAVHYGSTIGIAAPVLAEDVADGQRMEQVDGHAAQLPCQATSLTWTSGSSACSYLHDERSSHRRAARRSRSSPPRRPEGRTQRFRHRRGPAGALPGVGARRAARRVVPARWWPDRVHVRGPGRGARASVSRVGARPAEPRRLGLAGRWLRPHGHRRPRSRRCSTSSG